jgi:tetrahydromethanopterin S-methyltransferase subunit D
MIKVVNLVAVIIAPIAVQYADATGTTRLVVWAVGAALLGLLAWAVMRSKAPAPSMASVEIEAPKAEKISKKK